MGQSAGAIARQHPGEGVVAPPSAVQGRAAFLPLPAAQRQAWEIDDSGVTGLDIPIVELSEYGEPVCRDTAVDGREASLTAVILELMDEASPCSPGSHRLSRNNRTTRRYLVAEESITIRL